jgi:integrase
LYNGLWIKIAVAVEKLTALKVRRTAKPGLYGDGKGLYLRVGEGNAKSWVLRYMLAGRAHAMGLGAAYDISLAEARELARKYRKLAKEGRDPIEHRRAERAGTRLAAKAVTFKACAEAYIASHQTGWKGVRHAKQWERSLAVHGYSIMGELPVQAIDTPLVMRALERIWVEKTETAARLRGRIESILDYARAAGYRQGENPARWRGHLENLLPQRSKVHRAQHYAAISYARIPSFIAALQRRGGVADSALQFTILTAARSTEALAARWDEIDLEAKLWMIPAERMKADRPHVVPLSDAAIAVLDRMQEVRRVSGKFVFPGRRPGRTLGHGQMLRVIAAMGYQGVTTHGMRSSFRDWAGDCTDFPREVCEAALAHTIGDKSEAAYRRGSAIEKRRQLMAAWAQFCTEAVISGPVPSLPAECPEVIQAFGSILDANQMPGSVFKDRRG